MYGIQIEVLMYHAAKWWGAGVVVCLERRADLHMAQLMPLPLTVFCFRKIQMVLPFWYQLAWVVPEKGPLNGCVYWCIMLTYDNDRLTAFDPGQPG